MHSVILILSKNQVVRSILDFVCFSVQDRVSCFIILYIAIKLVIVLVNGYICADVKYNVRFVGMMNKC